MKIEIPEVKEDIPLEARAVTVATRLLDQVLEATVDTFSVRIAKPMPAESHDIVPVLLEPTRHLLERLQAGRHGVPVGFCSTR